MSSENTTQLIGKLAENLAPVRRIPRLRQAVLGVIVLWLVVGALALALRGVRPDLLEVLAPGSAFVVILIGLALVASGGVLAAMATSVPGREGAARVSLALGLGGVVLAGGVGAILVLREAGPMPTSCPFANDVACFAVCCLLALPPALAVLTFVSRGAPYRPLLAVLAATTGAVALGAMLVHVSCPATSARHLILGHALAPLVGALLLTLPFRAALKRVAGI
jgi:hypothetical protein